VGHEGRQRTSEDAIRAVLAAMGFDVDGERAARASLRRLDEDLRTRWIEPARVVRVGPRGASLEVRRPPALAGPLSLSREADAADGLGTRTGDGGSLAARAPAGL